MNIPYVVNCQNFMLNFRIFQIIRDYSIIQGHYYTRDNVK